ncbi:MAG: metallophosphoesterase [Saprospiraceae bacterium]|nr:metallophosphoesterase [Saprospiraceae bacterium]
MRFFILLIILIAIDVYAFQALRTIATPWSKAMRIGIFTPFVFISLLAYLYIVGGVQDWFDGWNKNAHIYGRAFVFIFFLSKLLVAVFMGLDDLRRLVLTAYNQFASNQPYDLSRSRFLSQVGLMLGAVPLLSLTYGMIRNTYRYKVHKVPIRVRNLPTGLDGLRIVQISDIHSGSFAFKEPISNGIDMINRLEPDLVFFTGDLVNSVANEMDPYVDLFSQIRAKEGIYSVVGNHDYGDYHQWSSAQEKLDNFEKLKNIHREMGWDLLLNENRMRTINGEQVAIIGVENYSALPRFHRYGDLSAASQGTSDAVFKMLLSHDPSHWNAQVTTDFLDIQLTLSGHTHGFQFGIEIPGWIKWSPSKYVYKQWAGLYQEGDQHLYVNRGFGVLGYPGRVGILPEITLIELKSLS